MILNSDKIVKSDLLKIKKHLRLPTMGRAVQWLINDYIKNNLSKEYFDEKLQQLEVKLAAIDKK